MAKKMSTGKVFALALCVIVGAGSIAALARGRDKDEEKEPAHVHDFSVTNICAECGERQETILFPDVKEGMDLSGYSVRFKLYEGEDPGEWIKRQENACIFKGFEIDSAAWIGFNAEGTVKVFAGRGVGTFELNIETDLPTQEVMIDCDEFGNKNETGLVLDERFSCVYSVVMKPTGEDLSAEAMESLNRVEFYYVGLEGATATATRSAAKRSPKTQTVDFWNSVNVSMAAEESEWTPIF